MDYKPSKTCREFMISDALVKCIIGPLGSGKSFAGIMELFRRSCEQEPDDKGIRPTRFAVVRNTLSQLRETFLADCNQYLGDFFIYKSSQTKLFFTFNLPDNTRVESEWLLMPLERPEDARKLLSLNLTAALIEEAREVRYEVVAALMGRIGRYPSQARVTPTWQSLLMISNPWSEGSEYHEHFVINKPLGWDFFHQPGGLDPKAENVQYLPKGYYQRLGDGHSDEWVRVHRDSEFGEDQYGQAVYRASFRREVHVWDGGEEGLDLQPNPFLPVLVGIDFGRTPSCVFTQLSTRGQLLVLDELTSEDMGLHGFCDDLLLPHIREHYADCRIFVVGDPAGSSKSQYNEETAYDVLEEHGLDAIPAPTNDPGQRVRAVERRLLDTVGGEPGLLIDGANCPQLVIGFLRDYRFRKQRDGELTPLPEKNDASHLADAMQYAALGHQSNYVGRRVVMRSNASIRNSRPRARAAGWT